MPWKIDWPEEFDNVKLLIFIVIDNIKRSTSTNANDIFLPDVNALSFILQDLGDGSSTYKLRRISTIRLKLKSEILQKLTPRNKENIHVVRNYKGLRIRNENGQTVFLQATKKLRSLSELGKNNFSLFSLDFGGEMFVFVIFSLVIPLSFLFLIALLTPEATQLLLLPSLLPLPLRFQIWVTINYILIS